MLYHAKNGSIPLDGTQMEYISFGTGPKPLVMLPGLGDALRRGRTSAPALAWMYRCYAKDYTVYVFSRKTRLAPGCSTRDMAADLAEGMGRLGLSQCAVLGISQGGMIAQHLAIDFPELADKLVLAVTLCRQTETSRQVISNWIRLGEAEDFKGIVLDMAEKVYTPKRARLQRPFLPLLYHCMKPASLTQFVIQANACLTHDSADGLRNIRCPVLAAGGGADRVLGGGAAGEIARRIPGSRLIEYPDLGHGAYEEAGDFNRRVLAFLASDG